MVRFLLKLSAIGLVSFFIISNVYAQSPTSQTLINIGETNILTGDDSGNGNLVIAQKVSLTQTATLQSLSFYVSVASGRLQLGIYNDLGGNPNSLLASTAIFTPTVGWNTQNVTTPILLSPGDYWLAYFPESNSLGFKADFSSGICKWYSTPFGSIPSTFSSSPNSCVTHWSFYATLTTQTVTLSPTSVPIGNSDTNGDGKVTTADLLPIFSNYGKNQGLPVDQYQDGYINMLDAQVVINFLTAPTPIPTRTPTPIPSTSTPYPTPSGSPVYPLKASANKRYLVDQNNVPFLMVGDSPQAMIANLSLVDAEIFLANRQKAGFNTMWVNLLCTSYTGCPYGGNTYDGIAPFTTPGDLSTPNEAYFARADAMMNLAAKYGMAVILDPIETGGWLGVLQSNGTTKDYNYGVYLGNRYKNFPNIVWMSGNDYAINSSNDVYVSAVANGIKSVDANHIHTIEFGGGDTSLDDSTWVPIVSLNSAYSYNPTYAVVLHGYNQSTMPVFMVEANYEFENNTGNDYGSPLLLRMQEYWSALSGETGQLYGNHYTWQFLGSWKSNLDTPGSQQFGYVTNLLAPRQWVNLVPDQNHTVVTAGYGTFSSTGAVHTNDYLTTARTPDGKLVIAYMPTSRTITVNMVQMTGGTSVTARWYDPTNGTYSTISGSPFGNTGSRQFTPLGNNSGGDGDWVLVLEAN